MKQASGYPGIRFVYRETPAFPYVLLSPVIGDGSRLGNMVTPANAALHPVPTMPSVSPPGYVAVWVDAYWGSAPPSMCLATHKPEGATHPNPERKRVGRRGIMHPASENYPTPAPRCRFGVPIAGVANTYVANGGALAG